MIIVIMLEVIIIVMIIIILMMIIVVLVVVISSCRQGTHPEFPELGLFPLASYYFHRKAKAQTNIKHNNPITFIVISCFLFQNKQVRLLGMSFAHPKTSVVVSCSSGE